MVKEARTTEGAGAHSTDPDPDGTEAITAVAKNRELLKITAESGCIGLFTVAYRPPDAGNCCKPQCVIHMY